MKDVLLIEFKDFLKQGEINVVFLYHNGNSDSSFPRAAEH